MAFYSQTTLKLVECNLDDMNPELFPWVSEQLFTAGARDVWCTPMIMKGGRPASCLSVLADPEKLEKLLEILFTETSTLGVRVSEVSRLELSRSMRTVQTPYGAVEVKIAQRPDGALLNVAPEFSSCRELARKHQVPLKSVYQAALKAYEQSEA